MAEFQAPAANVTVTLPGASNSAPVVLFVSLSVKKKRQTSTLELTFLDRRSALLEISPRPVIENSPPPMLVRSGGTVTSTLLTSVGWSPAVGVNRTSM